MTTRQFMTFKEAERLLIEQEIFASVRYGATQTFGVTPGSTVAGAPTESPTSFGATFPSKAVKDAFLAAVQELMQKGTLGPATLQSAKTSVRAPYQVGDIVTSRTSGPVTITEDNLRFIDGVWSVFHEGNQLGTSILTKLDLTDAQKADQQAQQQQQQAAPTATAGGGGGDPTQLGGDAFIGADGANGAAQPAPPGGDLRWNPTTQHWERNGTPVSEQEQAQLSSRILAYLDPATGEVVYLNVGSTGDPQISSDDISQVATQIIGTGPSGTGGSTGDPSDPSSYPWWDPNTFGPLPGSIQAVPDSSSPNGFTAKFVVDANRIESTFQQALEGRFGPEAQQSVAGFATPEQRQDVGLGAAGAAPQGQVETIDGRQFIRQPDGSLRALPPEEQPEVPSLEQQLSQAILDRDLDRAMGLQSFISQATPQERFQASLDFARSPADFFTISNIQGGNIPLSQSRQTPEQILNQIMDPSLDQQVREQIVAAFNERLSQGATPDQALGQLGFSTDQIQQFQQLSNQVTRVGPQANFLQQSFNELFNPEFSSLLQGAAPQPGVPGAGGTGLVPEDPASTPGGLGNIGGPDPGLTPTQPSTGLTQIRLEDGQTIFATQQQMDFLRQNNRTFEVVGGTAGTAGTTAGQLPATTGATGGATGALTQIRLADGQTISVTQEQIQFLQQNNQQFEIVGAPTTTTGGLIQIRLPDGQTTSVTQQQVDFLRQNNQQFEILSPSGGATGGGGFLSPTTGTIGESGFLGTPRLENLIQGNVQPIAAPVLPHAGLRAPSAQQIRRSSPEELEMFAEVARLSGIPQGTFERELRSATPLGGTNSLSFSGSRQQPTFRL